MAGCAMILALASCGGSATKQDEQPADSDPSQPAAALYLEGMYATSSKLPLSQYSPENMFDGKPDTYWSTAIGAASDEGIMLYFSGKTFVHEIRLSAATGSDLASINKVAIYGDGHRIMSGDPATTIKVDEDLSSLFIKIEETDHSNIVKVAEGDDGEQSLETFDRKLSVGLAEIEIFDNNGKLDVVPPVAVAGTVVATSVLSPTDAYATSQLFDSRKEFVWAEGGTGSGENESLTFSFGQDQTISLIKLWNGYQRSEKHFASNARIKAFEFGAKDADKVRYELPDSMEPQEIKLNIPLTGKEFVLTIHEAYPGKDYKDLVVSEILFFNGNRPFVVRNDEVEATMKALITKTKGSVLENYVDKRLKNHTESYDFTADKSLILRSNKTFVLYEHTTSNSGTKEEMIETVADGNWEVVEQNDKYAKVRVFGKLFNLSEAVEVYKGNTTKEFIKIFQDNLHITPEEVKGEKYVDAFFNRP